MEVNFALKEPIVLEMLIASYVASYIGMDSYSY